MCGSKPRRPRNGEAFAVLEKGYTVRDTRMTLVKRDDPFKALRGDARYAALMQRLMQRLMLV